MTLRRDIAFMILRTTAFSGWTPAILIQRKNSYGAIVMYSRRNFIEGVAAGVAATALSSSRVLGANERIRLGIIGPGARGKELMRFALACPNTEIAGVADVYTRRLEEARKLAPNAKTYLDYRHLLEDKSVDAVLIATPQHLHSEHFVASLDAG